eukprot:PhM_4_TR18431/c2_g1_i1/m.28835
MNKKLSRTSFAWSHITVVDESQNKYACNVMTADSDGVMIGCDHHFTIATRRGYKSIEEHLVKEHEAHCHVHRHYVAAIPPYKRKEALCYCAITSPNPGCNTPRSRLEWTS